MYTIPESKPLRVRDTGDYLTARGANPLTGRVSPSIGGRTPGSPGEALKVWDTAKLIGARLQPDKPESRVTSTAASNSVRPQIQQANEGKRILSKETAVTYTESLDACKHEYATNQALRDHAMAGSHVMADAAQSAALHAIRNACNDTRPTTGVPYQSPEDDRFVVNMPSAEEPQPYAHPGCTTAQIRAYEHYKRKSRTVSRQGYGERSGAVTETCSNDTHPLPNDGSALSERASVISIGAGPRKFAAASLALRACTPHETGNTGGEVRPIEPKRQITVIRRRPSWKGDILTDQDSPDLHSVIPRKPVGSSSEATQHEIPVLPTPLAPHQPPLVTREVPQSNRDRSDSLRLGAGATNNQRGDQMRVSGNNTSLHHQATLAVPKKSNLKQNHSVLDSRKQRNCSLGCPSTPDGACMVQQRSTSGQSDAPYPRWSSMGRDKAEGEKQNKRAAHDITIARPASIASPQGETATSIVEVAIYLAAAALRLCLKLKVPRLGLIDAMRSESASPAEKVAAFKALAVLTAQVVGCVVAFSLTLKLCNALKEILEIVLWPVIAPLRLLGWIIGVGNAR
ncbi:hypothetical protein K431DRAFT_48168 [Polychaeton citri CBS 116435]|uniref:Uncharacterized protein n=1 Tax=Polychaeton citri CBS 116435 TaxID=1314669 RepID=A0A9P4QIX0_9PEZI|nr:hypothetical protein K431DRAFT_48168 [Polychaeton citri CBS 116435]